MAITITYRYLKILGGSLLLFNCVAPILILWPILKDIWQLYDEGVITRGGARTECVSGDYSAPNGYECDSYERVYYPIEELTLKEAVDESLSSATRQIAIFTFLGVCFSLYAYFRTDLYQEK